MEQKNSNVLGLVSGVAVAAALGYAAGLLLADRPGAELRKDIESNSAKLAREIKDKFDEFFEGVKDFADEKLKDSATNLKEKIAVLGKQLREVSNKKVADYLQKV
jgi:gas vesicle protein